MPPGSGLPVVQFNERLVEMILDRLFPPVSLKSFTMLAGVAALRARSCIKLRERIAPRPGSAEMMLSDFEN